MKGTETVILSSDEIRIAGREDDWVMHKGEKSLMYKLAEIVTKNGGNILEVGFGMHISADAIQSNPNVTSHTIIEVHPEIYKHALMWAKNKPNTEIILGDWVNIIPTLDRKFDGILHDTHWDDNLYNFLNYVKPNCHKGTIVGLFGLPGRDSRISGYRHQITKEEFESLPYTIGESKRHAYELKYTIFNGIDFEKDKNIKSFI